MCSHIDVFQAVMKGIEEVESGAIQFYKELTISSNYANDPVQNPEWKDERALHRPSSRLVILSPLISHHPLLN